MVLSTKFRIPSACSYSNTHEVHCEDPPANDEAEAATQELRLGCTGHPLGISFRLLATASLLLGGTVASFTWATSFGPLSSKSFVKADGSDRLMMIGLAETVKGNSTEGDIRIIVCRDTNCNKFHPDGLVHEYTAFLNKCSTISSRRSKQTNGKYRIIGADASTIRPEMVLTAEHCNDDSSAPPVYHGPFSLTVGEFTDCCSFEHGGCGFKCITFPLNEVPPAYGGDGMDGGVIRIKVCRTDICDLIHPHGLVHEYTANLNTCAQIPKDTNTTTNGEYQIIGATAATLTGGTVLTAQQCGNMTDKVYHGPFSLIVGAFTDCCSFKHGGCGFKCFTLRQAYSKPTITWKQAYSDFVNLPSVSTAANLSKCNFTVDVYEPGNVRYGQQGVASYSLAQGECVPDGRGHPFGAYMVSDNITRVGNRFDSCFPLIQPVIVFYYSDVHCHNKADFYFHLFPHGKKQYGSSCCNVRTGLCGYECVTLG